MTNAVTVRRRSRSRRFGTGAIVLMATLVLFVIGLGVYFTRSGTTDAPVPTAFARGSPNAPVVFEEWGDFQ